MPGSLSGSGSDLRYQRCRCFRYQEWAEPQQEAGRAALHYSAHSADKPGRRKQPRRWGCLDAGFSNGRLSAAVTRSAGSGQRPEPLAHTRVAESGCDPRADKQQSQAQA